jgi:hypothetical protein
MYRHCIDVEIWPLAFWGDIVDKICMELATCTMMLCPQCRQSVKGGSNGHFNHAYPWSTFLLSLSL